MALPDEHLLGACACPWQEGAWRARLFVNVGAAGSELQLLDDVAAPESGDACVAVLVDVELVLPDGASLHFEGMPASSTIADVKQRLAQSWTQPLAEAASALADSDAASSAPAEAASVPAAANDDLDEVDELFAEFKQRTAAALSGPHSDTEAVTPPPSEPAAEEAAAPAPQPEQPAPSPSDRAGGVGSSAAQPMDEAPDAATLLQSAAERALTAVSWACAGAYNVGTWQPAAHLAALCTVVALVATLVGYTAFCTTAVAVMYARVLHEQRARDAAQAEAAQMRAEVAAAHRQIAATVAALARADELSGTGMCTRGAEDDSAEWLNAVFAACYSGWLSAWLSTTLAAAVSDGLRQRQPAGLEDIALLSLELEDKPPRLSAPHVQRSRAPNADGEHTLSFGLAIIGDVGVHLRLAARVSLLRARITLPVAFRASAADVSVLLTFVRAPPYVRRVRVSLLAAPRIDVSCRPFAALGGVDVTDIPGVDAWVQGAVEGALRRLLVEPSGHVFDIDAWWLAEQEKKRKTEMEAGAGAAKP